MEDYVTVDWITQLRLLEGVSLRGKKGQCTDMVKLQSHQMKRRALKSKVLLVDSKMQPKPVV